ncbi:MAG TPA: hypothetical protein VD929_03035 [Caulobacteraceae bacterium]|nr:hypothetical protein [Caulobacteraceae bacterium]
MANEETYRAPQPGPNDRPGANAAELKADINSGRSADKVDVFDPAMSPLGTDDEAGGAPMRPQDIALAREQERRDPEEKSFAPTDMSGWASDGAVSSTAGQIAHEEGSERRLSPAVAIGLVGGAALLALVFGVLA